MPNTMQPLDVKVRIHSFSPNSSVRARASVELGGCFAVRGIKIVNGKNGLFISMPSYQSNGKSHDVCFPVTKDFREQLNEAIFAEYQQQLAQTHEQSREMQRPAQQIPEAREVPDPFANPAPEPDQQDAGVQEMVM